MQISGAMAMMMLDSNDGEAEDEDDCAPCRAWATS